MIASEQHFPKGSPRARLRSAPIRCPLTGKAQVGAACIGGACEYAEAMDYFVSCTLTDRDRTRKEVPTGGNV